MKIDQFRGEYKFLSNFYMVDVYGYPSVEHAYQAAKTVEMEIRAQIRAAQTPGDAKRLGRKIDVRDDWEEIKIEVMETLIRRKFQQPLLQQKLLATTGELVEGNYWHDNFWGKCNCGKCREGENNLGKILMKVREELGSKETNSVLVFGSNSSGFHGAGSAGYAFRGDSRNTWRSDRDFLAAIEKSKRGEKVIGKHAVFGQSRGFQQGTEGASYAICTVTRPGAKRSITRKDICKQFIELFKFATANHEYTFQMTPVGCGYAGWSPAEMQEVLNWVIDKYGEPGNIRNIDCYLKMI